jgi:DNA-binding protein H-NS
MYGSPATVCGEAPRLTASAAGQPGEQLAWAGKVSTAAPGERRHPQEIPLAKTYAQIQLQIEKLKAQADALQKKETAGVVARIREAISHYGLTSEDLFGKGSRRQEKAPPKTASVRRKSKAKGQRVAVKFRDGDNTWTGRGTRPRWLVAKLAEGKTLEDFAV